MRLKRREAFIVDLTNEMFYNKVKRKEQLYE